MTFPNEHHSDQCHLDVDLFPFLTFITGLYQYVFVIHLVSYNLS